MTRSSLIHSLWLALAAALTPVSASAADSAPGNWVARGEVYDENGERLLYREYHLQPTEDVQAVPTRVEYRTPDGELFAEKTLDFSRSRTAPAIDFRDLRRDERIVTRYPDGSGRIEMIYHPPGDESPERNTFDTDSLIVDAGFDPFIRQHWDRLMDGDRLVSEFLVASRQDTVKVGIREVDAARCPTPVEGIRCLEVSPAGTLRLFSWFVDPIQLAYHPQPVRLMAFSGRGNIPDASGDPRQVRIHYEYGNTALAVSRYSADTPE